MKIRLLLNIGLFVSAVAGTMVLVLTAYFMASGRPSITHAQLAVAAAAAFAAILICGGIFTWVTTRKLNRALHQAASFLKTVAQGDFNANRPTPGNDETGSLNRRLCNTVDALKRRIGFAEGVLHAIADAYPFMTCDQDARIDFIGKQLLKVSGKTGDPSEYLGLTIGGYIYGDDTRKTRTDRVVAEGIRVEGETRIEGDGITHVLQFSADPIYDLDNEQIGALTIYFDLTEVKKQQEEIEANAQRVAQIASELVDITEQVNSSAEVIASQINEAARGAELQSERTTETATAMEQMNSTTMEVARNAVSAADNAGDAKEVASAGQNEVHSLIDSIETMRGQSETLAGFMDELGQQTDAVGNVINVIQDIADQTNLLALNAAIEAARAGEAGRGFAVVADEVRKLAEKTMSATKEVGAAIKAIQDGAQRSIEGVSQASKAVEQSTELARNSGQTLEKIVNIVNNTSDQVQSIATAAEQQSASSEEIHRAVEDITAIASQTSNGMQEANEVSDSLAGMCRELNTLIRRLSA
jgi:methyl-accepting chemotaxis protein